MTIQSTDEQQVIVKANATLFAPIIESSGSKVSKEGLGSTTDPKFTLAISLFLAGNWCGWNIEENEKGGM